MCMRVSKDGVQTILTLLSGRSSIIKTTFATHSKPTDGSFYMSTDVPRKYFIEDCIENAGKFCIVQYKSKKTSNGTEYIHGVVLKKNYDTKFEAEYDIARLVFSGVKIV